MPCEPKKEAIQDFLSFIGAEHTTCQKSSWEEAKVNGLLKQMNAKISRDTSFIADHYKSKGIYYIQIGGAGLFYLSENPANLPIPKLEGCIDIELRAGRSGSKKNASGVPVFGTVACPRSLKVLEGGSQTTLDNSESVREMILDWASEKWSGLVSNSIKVRCPLMRGVLLCFAMFMVGCGWLISKSHAHVTIIISTIVTRTINTVTTQSPIGSLLTSITSTMITMGKEGECGFWYVGNGA